MTDEQVTPTTEDVEVNNEALPNDGESEETVVQQPAAEVVDEFEERARLQGWKPKDEYGGKPEGWVDAKSYVERADNELPIAKATVRKLENEVTQMRESFEKMRKFEMERAKAQALEELRGKHTKAIDEDGVNPEDAFKAYEQEKMAIDRQYTEPEAPKTPQVPHDVQEWISSNPWANATDDLGLFAQALERSIGNTNPNYTPLQVLNEVKKRSMQAFPDRFANPKRKMQSIEGGGTVHKTGNQNLSTTVKFNKLAAVDQNLALRLINKGDFKDKAEFLKDYESMYGQIK